MSEEHRSSKATDLDLIREARQSMGGGNRTAGSMPVALPGYDFVRELSRGGQGVVYQAIQKSTGQDVAIKFLRHGTVSTEVEQDRMQREIAILAQLQHPSIISIHDGGRVDGIAYVVMDFVDGRPLDEHMAESAPSRRESIALFRDIAAAIQSAHVRGVIHRDLKPANILVSRDGMPHIVDFGLAKLNDGSNAHPTLTQDGQFMGSLPWSAPEQARGDHESVDVRTDVYALGVVYWQVLAGAFPYAVDGDPESILRNIAHAKPSTTVADRARLGADLETILRRCLAKDPERRYQNAGELASDLQCCLDGRPIMARRDSQWYVLRRTIARHRIVCGLLTLIFLIAAGSSIGFGLLYATGEASRVLADQQRRAAERHAYRAALFAASAGYLPNDAAAAQFSLDAAPHDLRGWEWRYLSGIADESLLALREHGGDVPFGAAWSADGTLLVTGSFDGNVRIWDASTGACLRLLAGHTDRVFDLAMSPDGTTVASGARDRTVRLWNVADGTLRRQLEAPERVTDVEFSPDGRRIAAAASYAQVAIEWDVATGAELQRLPAQGPMVQCVAYSPDGTLIATGSTEYAGGRGEATVRIHDADRGAVVREIPAATWSVTKIAFSPDGARVAAATATDAITIWSLVDESAPPVHLRGIGRQPNDLRFSDDGSRVFAAGHDGLVHVSDSRTGERIDSFRGHRGKIDRLALHPAGHRLATSSADGTVRIWNLEEHPGRRVLTGHDHGVDHVVFSPDDRWLISGSRDATIRVWDTTSWKATRVLDAHVAGVAALAFSTDGSLMVSGNLGVDGAKHGTIHVWDREWNNRQLAGGLPGVAALAFRPGSRQLAAVLSAQGSMHIWNTETGLEVSGPAGLPALRRVAFDHAGRHLIALALNGSVYICDPDTLAIERTLTLEEADLMRPARGLSQSPDDAFLAVGAFRGVTAIWRTDTWEEHGRIGRRGDSAVTSLDFSPDGRRLAIGHATGVTIADVESSMDLVTLRDVTDVYSVAFSHDGRHLAASSSDGTVRVWTASGIDDPGP